MAADNKTKRTSISAGIAIRNLLLADERIKNTVTKVFPVVTDTATLPYIMFRRTAIDPMSVKTSSPADYTEVEVFCFARSYDESINLAEAARDALDRKKYPEMGMSGCNMVNSEDLAEDDAYVQRLVFRIMM